MPKKSVYVETTIPSYATANPSNDLIKAGRQALTKLFWEQAQQNYDLFISQYVIDECAKGDSAAAQRRLNFVAGITMAEITKNVDTLALAYQDLLQIPEKAKADCFHLAICVDTGIDYLLSWNFKHLSFVSHEKLVLYNRQHGLPTPFLVTPVMLNKKEL